MPAALRKKLRLRPGQPLMWKMISDTECRVLIVRNSAAGDRPSMRGFMKSFHKQGTPQTTNAWMKMLREGEQG
jgi:bifunctional DNA-binding transcriptional regulator/antitoxin component of YhaV-PrlF toxin-antitoxin module